MLKKILNYIKNIGKDVHNGEEMEKIIQEMFQDAIKDFEKSIDK